MLGGVVGIVRGRDGMAEGVLQLDCRHGVWDGEQESLSGLMYSNVRLVS